ncbi:MULTISPECIES: ATP synthase F1 subunit gamma [Zunongwangia]|jgi:F-type H+-transporting ATPase subunit gamma|uniref:ATP synthase gamma chain n=2 Tax=Zunongwangia profunda TaxID=398743 RepID=D5BBJ5_ZUNPS|nr:ATP synthase F1 subunit gamma [Zunongwangia profunda]ADF50429.1 ATP synthase subunit gamma [Zunongwangia profunda SM-A87]MAG87978.1 ATP synthase F1 subunit gamma [Flavobacteriaceae bacterium]MCC4230309.1 ATP synthase F1 subunit gamma [Zunongwangia profunda]HAJ81658.1 ATP synthase F1 subunit gamma [Zunongwangia profunda]|tara:strand:- start:7377 stop:8237 length:861 start_codon:yes stop_codon:yes gene_type:complete
MANLKELRSRITSVSSTMQITSAMKMVSAAKLSKAQDAIESMRPYSQKLSQLLQDLSATLDDDTSSKYAEQREVQKVLVVAISSNRGLAGAFNANIIKGVKNAVAKEYSNKDVHLYSIGKKANDILKRSFKVYKTNTEIFEDLSFENVSVIAEDLMEQFLEGNYDKIVLVYNHFKNAATQAVLTEQFLPIPKFETEEEKQLDYIFEPSKLEIVKDLIPKSLKMQLYKALRDSFASEHGARMTAMHKATENATELRDSLKLSYNKARQASITNEILEIVGGAEALNN